MYVVFCVCFAVASVGRDERQRAAHQRPGREVLVGQGRGGDRQRSHVASQGEFNFFSAVTFRGQQIEQDPSRIPG